MIQLSSKNDGSSLCYDVISTNFFKNLKTNKLGDFSCDIDYNSRTDVFRDVISLIVNQCEPRRPKCAPCGYEVFTARVAQASKSS